jgi:hypothetical protein
MASGTAMTTATDRNAAMAGKKRFMSSPFEMDWHEGRGRSGRLPTN